jgi:hypothetical protein
MLGRTPFSDALADKRGLPFHFVWDESLPYVYESALHFGEDDIRRVDAQAAEPIEARRYAALIVGETVYVDGLSQRGRERGETFGICAAQRRKSGQVWVVVSGLTGVSTYVAAELVGRLSTRLDETHRYQNSPVYWGLVRSSVPEHGPRPLTSQREFPEERILAQPETSAATGK